MAAAARLGRSTEIERNEGPMDDTSSARALDTTQRDAIATNRTDRKRSLDALHVLEACAATAAPGRETDWLARVRAALEALEDALDEQAQNSAVSESMLSDIEQENPRLRNRVMQLRRRHRELQLRAGELRVHLDESPASEGIDFADIRRRLERLAAELRYQEAREADLVYEAYTVDLGAGD
jgi:septal ring factor EnvC (AmiA/AmiB activator)